MWAWGKSLPLGEVAQRFEVSTRQSEWQRFLEWTDPCGDSNGCSEASQTSSIRLQQQQEGASGAGYRQGPQRARQECGEPGKNAAIEDADVQIQNP